MNRMNVLVSIATLISLAGISQAEYNDIWGREILADDLFGLHPWLDEQGIIINMAYTGETFSNLRGGLNTSGASEYRGNFDVTLTADAEKFGLGQGSIFIYTQLGRGEPKGMSVRRSCLILSVKNTKDVGYATVARNLRLLTECGLCRVVRFR